MSKSKGPTQRQLRVGELVRHAVTDVLQREELDDPALSGQVLSITEVRMSPDLKIATCYVSPLGGSLNDGGDTKAICDALDRSAGFIRARAQPHLNQMKFLPRLRFRADTSFDNFSRIDALLRSEAVQRDIKDKDED